MFLGGGGGWTLWFCHRALGADVPVSSAGPEALCVDVRDNELDKLVSHLLRVSEAGVVGERVLDPYPTDGVLEASAGQSGVPQEEVLESSHSFSDSCVTPSSGVSGVLEGSAGDGSASLGLDSRPLRSRIPVKISRVGASGDCQPPLVSPEQTALMVQQLKVSLPMIFGLQGGLTVRLSVRAFLLFCFLPGSVLSLARGWLFLHLLVSGPVPVRGLAFSLDSHRSSR